MKILKRNIILFFKIIIATTVLSISEKVYAQQKGAVSKISVGGAIAIPTGNSILTYRRGYGGSITGEHNLIKNLNLIASVGFMAFQYRRDVKARMENFGEMNEVSGMIPLKVGARLYFGGIYYIDAQAGVVLSTGNNNFNAFTYAPSGGVNIPFTPKLSMDFGLRYEGWLKGRKTVSFFGVRMAVAYAF